MKKRPGSSWMLGDLVRFLLEWKIRKQFLVQHLKCHTLSLSLLNVKDNTCLYLVYNVQIFLMSGFCVQAVHICYAIHVINFFSVYHFC